MKAAVVLLLFCATSLAATTCRWTTANLTIPRGYMGVATLDHLGFFAGGEIPGTPYSAQNRIDIWNSMTNTWTTANLSEARFAFQGTSIPSAKLVLFAGGNIGEHIPTNTVDIYNHNNGAWSTARLSVARFDPVASSNGKYAFFAGGLNDTKIPWGPVDAVDIYDSSTNTWSVDKLSQARGSFISKSVGTTVMFAGGLWANGTDLTADAPSDVVDILNVTSMTWTVNHLSVARWGLSAVLVNNQVVFASGSVKTSLTTRVDIYNYDTKIWSIAELTESRLWSTSAFFNGMGWIIGGEPINYSRRITSIEMYDGKNWTKSEMPQGKKELSAITVNDWLLIAGYSTPNSVDVYHCGYPEATSSPLVSSTSSPLVSATSRPKADTSSASLMGLSAVVSALLLL